MSTPPGLPRMPCFTWITRSAKTKRPPPRAPAGQIAVARTKYTQGESKLTMLAAQQIHATRGRWYILLLISLMYLITYLDRVNISTAAPVISKEFGFDKITMGIIFSAFVWAYAIFQVPGGWLSDRFGARPVLATIVTYWSIMTAATAAATGAVSFVIIRFLFGM